MKENKEKYVISSEAEYLYVKTIFNKLFLPEFFPKKMFKNDNWGIIILESWRLFNMETFSKFQLFIECFENERLYITPKNIRKVDYRAYKKSIDIKGFYKSEYGIPLCFEPNITFDLFQKLQTHFNYNNIDSVLFSNSEKWAFYTNPSLDIMILGYDTSIFEFVNKFYKNYSERILTMEKVDQLIIDETGKSELDKLNEFYADAFDG